MIKKVLLLVLLLAVTAGANDLRAVFSDSIIPTDSTDFRYDTIRTPSMYVGDFSWIQFYSQVKAYENRDDTNFVDDTFFVYAQFSPDGVIWNTIDTICVDTFVDNGSGWSIQNLTFDDKVMGSYMRGVMVHCDSVGNAADSTLVNRSSPFYKEFILWICGSKAK